MRKDVAVSAKDLLFRYGTRLHRAIYSASRGKVIGRGRGMPMVVLTTTGHKTGLKRDTMLTAPLVTGEAVVLVASYFGDDREPMWCRNIRANGDVELTLEGRTRRMRAHVAEADERADLWPRVVAAHPFYGGYQKKTVREIPLVVVEPLPAD